MIEIVNLKLIKPSKSYDFLIDRRSPLGNPYLMKGEYNRYKVCDDYHKYFYDTLLYKPYPKQYLKQMLEVLIRHKQLRLFCWCYPKRCHGETIKSYLEKLI